jgi:hypothetical protein
MGPTELQQRLKKKYGFEVPYNNVFRGKEKAEDMMFGKWDDSYDLLACCPHIEQRYSNQPRKRC